MSLARDGTGGTGGAAGGGGFAGLSGAGGSSPTIDTNGDASFGGGSPVGPDAACQAVSAEAENEVQPADIVFAVDNSGSMDEESVWVQKNLNRFSERISGANIDVRVILLSAYPKEKDNGMCIEPPLGAGGCPSKDTNLPRFLHVDTEVSSHDSLEIFLDAYPKYRDSLRLNATKHFVVVSDDESEMSAAAFTRDIVARDSAMLSGFKFHGIFSYTEGKKDHCKGFSSGEGKVYKELVAQTGGVSGDLCLQDFDPVFDALAQSVIGTSKLACEWAIPAPPSGRSFVKNQTNVTYKGSASVPGPQVPHVASQADCEKALSGWAWYYDDNAQPSHIRVCARACEAVQKDASARIDIQFGCDTVDVPR